MENRNVIAELDDRQLDQVSGGGILDAIKDAITQVVPGHETTVSAVSSAASWIRSHL